MCEVLVEDEPNIRMVAAELLADSGYHVVEFEMAADAKAFAEVPKLADNITCGRQNVGE